MISSIQKASKEIEKQLDTKTQNDKTLSQKNLYILLGTTLLNLIAAASVVMALYH